MVRYSGDLGVPGGQQVLEFEDLLGLRPKAVTSLRSDLFTFTYMMDTFENAAYTAGQASARVKPGPGRYMCLCLLNSKYLQSNSSCMSFSEATLATHY